MPQGGLSASLDVTFLVGLGHRASRAPVRAAPWYSQFDAYRQVLRCGRLWLGNRNPWQRWKRRRLLKLWGQGA